jgi:hypothetical protein
MNDSILKKMEEFFKSPEKFSPDHLEEFIQETLEYFSSLRSKMTSPEAASREEAMQTAVNLKEELEQQMLTLCQSLNMSTQEIETYINASKHFSADEWKAMEKARQELDQYKEAVANMEPESSRSKKPQNKKPKVVKDWLVG